MRLTFKCCSEGIVQYCRIHSRVPSRAREMLCFLSALSQGWSLKLSEITLVKGHLSSGAVANARLGVSYAGLGS